jgi:putative ABC transport system ATP-binding protein
MDAVLQFDRLTVQAGGRCVLHELTLDISRGEKVVLSGESGAGKSTAIRCMLGFVSPSSGRALVNQHEVKPVTAWGIRRQVGYVAQEPPMPAAKVRDVLAEPYTYQANQHLSFDAGRARELLEVLHLPGEFLDRAANDLSGGEKQRVAVAAALLLERSIYLLDEPTSALDTVNARILADYLLSRHDLTILAVTHDPEAFAGWDRTVSLAAVSREISA